MGNKNKNKKEIMKDFLINLYQNLKKGGVVLLILIAFFLSIVGIIGTNFFKINIIEFIPDSGGNKLYFLNEVHQGETTISFYLNYNDAVIEEQGIAGLNLDLNFDSSKLSYQSGSLICDSSDSNLKSFVNDDNTEKLTIVTYKETGVFNSAISGYTFNNFKLCQLKFNNLVGDDLVEDLTIDNISIADFHGNELVDSFKVLNESLNITAIKPVININYPQESKTFNLGEIIDFEVDIIDWNDSLGSQTASGVVISDILENEMVLTCEEDICSGSGALKMTWSGGYFDFEVNISNKIGAVSSDNINLEIKAPLVKISCNPKVYLTNKETTFTCQSDDKNIPPDLSWSYTELEETGSGGTVVNFGSWSEIAASFSGTYLNNIEVFGENLVGTGYTIIEAKNEPIIKSFYKYKFQGSSLFSEVPSESGAILYFGQSLDYQFRYEVTDQDEENYDRNVLLTVEELNGLDADSILFTKNVLTKDNDYSTEIRVTASGSFILKATAIDQDGFNAEQKIRIVASNTPRLVSNVLGNGEFSYGQELNESLVLTKDGNFKFFNVEDNNGGTGSGEVLLANIGLSLSETGEITGVLDRVGEFTTVIRIEEYDSDDNLQDIYLDVLTFKGYLLLWGDIKNTVGNTLPSVKVSLFKYNEEYANDREYLWFTNTNETGIFSFSKKLYWSFGKEDEEPQMERYQFKLEATNYETSYTDENWKDARTVILINKEGYVTLGNTWEKTTSGLYSSAIMEPERVTLRVKVKDINGRVYKGVRLKAEGVSLTGQNYEEELSCLTDKDGECVINNLTRPNNQMLKMSYKVVNNDPIVNKYKDVFIDSTQNITIPNGEESIVKDFILVTKPVALKIKVVSKNNPEEDRLLGLNITVGQEVGISDDLFLWLVKETDTFYKGKFTVGNSYSVNITDSKGFYYPINFKLKIPTGMYTLGSEDGSTTKKLIADFTGWTISNTISQIAGKDEITKDGEVIISEISERYVQNSSIKIDNVENYGDRIIVYLETISDRECTSADLVCSESCGGGVYKLKEGLSCIDWMLGKECNIQNCVNISRGWGWGWGWGWGGWWLIRTHNADIVKTGRVNTKLRVKNKKIDFGYSRVQGRSEYQITGETGEITMIGENGNIEFKVTANTVLKFEKWSALLNKPEYSSLIKEYNNKPVIALVKVANTGLTFTNPFQLIINNIGDNYSKNEVEIFYGKSIKELVLLSKDKYEVGNGKVVIKANSGKYFLLVENKLVGSNYEKKIGENRENISSLKRLGLSSYLKTLYSKVVVFKDVNKHWSKWFVAELQYKWLISGYEDGTFKPNNYINRAELLKMVILASEKPLVAVEETSFADIKINDWFTPYIESAKKYQIASGYLEGEKEYFYPSRNITRAEALKIIMESFKIELNLKDTFIDEMLETVVDVNGEEWYSTYVAWWISKKVIKSFTEDSNIYFRPNEFITRAEATEMIVLIGNFYDKILVSN